jgi:hypothetical protein
MLLVRAFLFKYNQILTPTIYSKDVLIMDRTARLKSIFMIITFSLMTLPLNAKDQFFINEGAFIPKYKEECSTNTKLSMEGGKYKGDGMVDVKGGLYCHKAKHTLIGEVSIFNYLFKSDNDNPLQFVVDKDKGYVYVKGKGTITKPDGKIINLPQK